jgi:hypothetical protein
MPPREAYRQSRQSVATFRFDGAAGVGAEHIQFVITACMPCRLTGQVIVLVHLRSIVESEPAGWARAAPRAVP